jgi:hypothetical protein
MNETGDRGVDTRRATPAAAFAMGKFRLNDSRGITAARHEPRRRHKYLGEVV